MYPVHKTRDKKKIEIEVFGILRQSSHAQAFAVTIYRAITSKQPLALRARTARQ
jgi:hypothetical protein